MENELLAQLKLVFKVMASDDFTDTVATFLWNLYNKLKQKGFTDEQAMNIVINFDKGKK